MPSNVSFSFYFATSSAATDAAAGGLFSPFPLRAPVCVCVYINGSIIISYRCNQRRVSIKVFAWGLRGSKTQAGAFTRGGKHRHSLIHGHSMKHSGGVQILPHWHRRPHSWAWLHGVCALAFFLFFFFWRLCARVCMTHVEAIRWTPSDWPWVCVREWLSSLQQWSHINSS